MEQNQKKICMGMDCGQLSSGCNYVRTLDRCSTEGSKRQNARKSAQFATRCDEFIDQIGFKPNMDGRKQLLK